MSKIEYIQNNKLVIEEFNNRIIALSVVNELLVAGNTKSVTIDSDTVYTYSDGIMKIS